MCFFSCNGVKISHWLINKGSVGEIDFYTVLGVCCNSICRLTAPAECRGSVRSVALALFNRSQILNAVEHHRHCAADAMHTNGDFQRILVAM